MTDNPYLPFAAKILEIRTHTDVEFTIRVKAECDITPGQFFQLSLPKIGEAPISVSAYDKDWIEFTIRAVGRLTNALKNLGKGRQIFIRGPYGQGFSSTALVDKDVIIVAGGSGVAPVKPLIENILASKIKCKSLKVILGFKDLSAILFQESIEKWQRNLDVTLTIDKPQDDWHGKTGLVTEHIRQLGNLFTDCQAVVVGPPVMMKFATAEFRLLGLPAENIWVSFERHMSCGIGKCGHCKIDNTYVCVDGPVLNYSHAAELID